MTILSSDAATPDAATAGDEQLPEYDWEEICRHDKAGDFWVAFCGGVYDVSEWMYRHPGGAEILIEAWGQDATDFFNSIGHTDEAWLLTQSFKVGRVREGAAPPAEAGTPTMTVPEEPKLHGPGEHQSGPKVNPLPEPEDAPADPRELPAYDWDEILRHDKHGDYWVVMWGDVYDLSEWIYHHPGGAEVLIESYGRDASGWFDGAGHSGRGLEPRADVQDRTPEGGLEAARASGAPDAVEGVSEARTPIGPIRRTDAGPREIPYAIRWLVPNGERFANFDIHQRQRHPARLLAAVRPHLRGRHPDEEVAPGRRL